MKQRFKRPSYAVFIRLCALVGACVAASSSATAHPHVWVTYQTTIMYANGSVTGLQQVWTFDDMYTAMAIQGLDKNGDGKYDRTELAELAKINMDGLKEFGFFTYARLQNKGLDFDAPVDPWLEYTGSVLKLHFQLPLKQPVLAEADGFSFSVYDPSWFIAFDPEKTDPIKVSASAPTDCKVALRDQNAEQTTDDVKRLGDTLAAELGGAGTFSLGTAKTVSVSCKKT